MVVMLGFRFTVKTVTDEPMSVALFMHASLLYFVVIKSSLSLSHLLMSFLLSLLI